MSSASPTAVEAATCPVHDNAAANSLEIEPIANRYAEKARSAVIWNAGFSIFRDFLQFGQMLVLARLLRPEAYGQFGLTASITGALAVFASKNFVGHALQVRSDEETRFQEHFTAGAFLQIALFLSANGLAVLLRFLPKYTEIALLLHVTSLNFLLAWPCDLYVTMLERKLDWRRLRLLHGIGLLASVLAALCMAWAGAGAFSLVAPALFVSLPFIYDLFVRRRWRPTWQWSWDHYRPSFEFGVTRIGTGLSISGRQLLESSVLAATLGFGPLGLMNRAFGISQMACGKLATQLMYAIYPILTRLDTDDGRAGIAGNLILRFVAWTTLPIAVCLGCLALPVVDFVYGSQWLSVSSLLPWALAGAVGSAVMHVLYMLALARKRARLCLACDLLVLGGTAINLFMSLPRGIAAYFAGFVIVQMAAATVMLLTLLRLEAISLRGLGAAVFPSAGSAAAAFAFASAVAPLIMPQQGADFVPAALWGTIFFVSYVVALRLLFAGPLRQLVSYLPARALVSRALLLTPL